MGFGSQWEACFGTVEKVVELLPEVIKSGRLAQTLGENDPKSGDIPEGSSCFALEYGDSPLNCLAIITREPGEKSLTLSSAYPFLREGAPVTLGILEINKDEDGLEACLKCTTKDRTEISFFEPLYPCCRNTYGTGEVYEFSLAALAYLIEPVLDTDIKIQSGPLLELERQRRLEEDPRADVSGITCVTVSMAEMRTIFPQENRMDAEFQTVIEDVSSFRFEGTQFHRMRVVLIRRDEQDIEAYLYASEHVLKDYHPKVGDSIRGVLWLQGYPLRPIQNHEEWPKIDDEDQERENVARAMASEEYFSDLHVGASAFCRSLVYTGWDVAKYDNPTKNPHVPVALIERDDRQVNVWVRAFIKDFEPEYAFSDEEIEDYSRQSIARGQDAVFAIVECTDIGDDRYAFKYLNREAVEQQIGKINYMTAGRKTKDGDQRQRAIVE